MSTNPKVSKTNKSVEIVNKSNTLVNLPKISKIVNKAQTDRKPHKLSYIQSIHNIFDKIQNSDKNSSFITNQQSKLKQVLKKMNNETHHIISTIKPKNNLVKMQSEGFILIDKQIENSKKSIVMMQSQMIKLQDKFTNVVYPQHLQEISIKIQQINKQIDEVRASNSQMKSAIEKDSIRIVKEGGEGYGQRLEELESQNSLFGNKLERLKNDNGKAIEENSKIQVKIKEVEMKIQEYEQEYQNIKNNSLSDVNNRNKEIIYGQRKIFIQTTRKKIELHKNNLQYKYTKLSKELSTKKTNLIDISSKQIDLDTKVAISKQQIQTLQIDLTDAKKP